MERHGGFLRRLAAGMLIGIGCVLPGVSGGVMAVSFGLYRPMLNAVLDFFHDTRAKLAFLLPLGIGGALGILAGARGLGAAMARYEVQMLYLFIGFILGGVPELLREAEGDEAFRPGWLWGLAAGIALALPLALVPGRGASVARLTPLQAILAGVMEGVGTVVPGISTSLVLMRLGWYQAYLRAVSTAQAEALLCIGLGFAVSALACMKAVAWLFDHARAYAYYAVLGFLLVSVALVFPGFEGGRALFADAAMLVAGLAGARWMNGIGPEKNT